ncbi:MAG: FG-GAP repeat protein [Chloracidobacterium sp.]|nr:FG-GAP repeat protein [Chloracidobacterium sp.]
MTASDGLTFDRFGGNIAIDDGTAVMSASGQSVGSQIDIGSAYLFLDTTNVPAICGPMVPAPRRSQQHVIALADPNPATGDLDASRCQLCPFRAGHVQCCR